MIILLLILFFLLIFDFKKYKKIYTPSIFFNGIFFITLFLYNLYLSELQQKLSNRTMLILYLCVIAFNIANPFIRFLKFIFIHYFKTKIVFKKTKYTFRFKEKQMFWITLIFFMILVVYSRGVPLIWKIIGSDKTYFDFGIPSLTGLFYAYLSLVSAYSLNKKGIYKYFYMFLGVIILSRQLLITMCVEAIIIRLLIKRGKIKYSRVVLIGIFAVLCFSLMGNIRTGNDSFLAVAKFKKIYDWIPVSFKWIYSYMCFSLSNLNNLVSMTPGSVDYGANCFNELMPTVVSNWLNLKVNFNQNFLVSINFTVSTFIPPLYLDFGCVGIFIFCFMLGLISNFTYSRVRANLNLVNIFVYAVLIHNIVLLFFTNMFLYLPVIGQLLFIPIIFKKEGKTHYEDISNWKCWSTWL